VRMIFVQITSYRDPEVLPTIVDCIARARHPRDLRFGICWQHTAEDCALRGLSRDKRFRIDDVPWHESRGLGWARARTQSLYEGEEYTLYLDSHHRFSDSWDARLLELVELTSSPKPALTTFGGSYDPMMNDQRNPQPFTIVAEKFRESGALHLRPEGILDWQQMNRPLPARFASRHFFFTLGTHCHECPSDPALYFEGTGTSLGLRSYTQGFDLFHPHQQIVWHEYSRAGRPRHWDDHHEGSKSVTGLSWQERDAIGHRRLRKLLGQEDNDEDLGQFGLGSVRSLADYERHAGVDFDIRSLL